MVCPWIKMLGEGQGGLGREGGETKRKEKKAVSIRIETTTKQALLRNRWQSLWKCSIFSNCY